LSDQRSDPDERDVLTTLVRLAGESRVYRLHLEEVRPVIERLAAEVDDVGTAMLLTSVRALVTNRLGTPAHVEGLALAALRELKE
jgi:hypothetical protein